MNQIFDDNKRNPNLVNYDLYKLLVEEDFLRLAHRSLIPANQKDFYERPGLVREVAKELQGEQFQFEVLPPPKGEQLAYYTPPPFRDKLVIEALRLALEHIYEPIFLESSHGYRPSLSRHTALMCVRRELRHHKLAVVSRVDTHELNPHVLVNLLETKIRDARFIRLIWKALKAGHGNRKHHVWGIKNAWDGKLESSTLSTLFSNIYLHALDCWIRDKKQALDSERVGVQQLFYVRYADEFLLSCIASKQELLSFKDDLETFLEKISLAGESNVSRLGTSHAFFLGTKITVSKEGRVRLEAPMDKIIIELAKLGMVSVGGTLPHPVTYLARCTHNEIISYYNWVMRGCCTYYSFVDNFYQLTSYMRLAIRSSCVRTLTMKLKRFRSARTYKDFGTECAARYRVPIRNGAVVDDQLSEEERDLLEKRMKAANRLRLNWEELGSIEKGLLRRFIIPRRILEPNGDVNLEFRGDYLLFCSKKTEHEETKRILRKMELLPPPQDIWNFSDTLVPPPRPRLSVDYESLYPH